MKKDLYPHGSRELVDPKKHPASEHDRPPSNRTRPSFMVKRTGGLEAESNHQTLPRRRRDSGGPFTIDFHAQGHGQADDAQAQVWGAQTPRLRGQLGAHAHVLLAAATPREVPPLISARRACPFLSPPSAPLCRRCQCTYLDYLLLESVGRPF